MGISVSLLGNMVVTEDNQPIEFATEGVRALLAYLLAHPDIPFTRVQLATLLWPEHPQGKALRNLRMTLTRLRQAIGNERISEEVTEKTLIVANRVHIKSLATDIVTLDTAEILQWQHQLEAYQNKKNQRRIIRIWEKILAIHRGKFLADLRWNSPTFEEWRSQQERHWHLWALMGWDLLAAHYSSTRQTEKVIFAAQQLLALEPWHEKAHSYLIEAWLSKGNRLNAIHQYEQY